VQSEFGVWLCDCRINALKHEANKSRNTWKYCSVKCSSDIIKNAGLFESSQVSPAFPSGESDVNLLKPSGNFTCDQV
jgi:hypothetical protein